ncbi:hypothetical protein FRX31_015907 [Thalictrum thalictroides]|uniref:Uncharacterized protein n=1 Tax=Thalictrum thalictroides TaxID=46969 RepID=A0A7J6WAQ0_THATH|nr:hypothetical protein FRX31_015907 [Thalictrum thalictroides]
MGEYGQMNKVLVLISHASTSRHGTANARYPMGSWDDGNTMLISQPSNKRAKTIDGGVIAALSGVHSQMVVVEKLLQMQLDSVPCKIRAKLDFTTHPRNIVERVSEVPCFCRD